MRLLQFVQTVNNTLGAVETGRSLVVGRPGVAGNGPVSALSQQINHVGAELTSEIRGARDVLRQDIHTVNSMVSQVQAQQVVLRQEIQNVMEGVGVLNTLMRHHMTAVEDQLRFIIDEDLQNSCYQLTAHLTNNEGVSVTDDEIRAWLRILQTWIGKASTRKTATLSSEDAVRMFTQSPDNIGLMISRLYLLFGDIIPEKFLSLPFVSLKFYFLVTKLYLNTLEKNPHLLSSDKAQTICQGILDTLKTYLEFSEFLKNYPKIIQALFDLYDHYQDHYSKTHMEETRFLLVATAKIIEGDSPSKLTDRALKLVSLEQFRSFESMSGKRRIAAIENLVGSMMTEVEKYRLNIFHWTAVDFNSCTSYYMKRYEHAFNTDTPHYFQRAVDLLYTCVLMRDINAHDLLKLYTSTTQKPFLPYGKSLGQCEYEAFRYTDSENLLYIIGGSDAAQFSHTSGFYHYATGAANREWYEALNNRCELSVALKPARDILVVAFEYYKLMSQGRLRDAELFLQKNNVNHYYLLLLTAIIGPKEGRWDIFENFIKKYPVENFNYSQTVENGSLTPLMIAAQHGRKKVVNALLLLMNKADIAKFSSENKTAAHYACEQGFPDIADMLNYAQWGTLSSVAATPATVVASDYENGLEEMRSSVSATITKLGEYIPAPPPAQQTAPSAQVADPLPELVTDDEQEEDLNAEAREFFTEAKMHAGINTFCSKPTERLYRRTGFRIFDNTLFRDDKQRRDLSRTLQKKNFDVSREEELGNKLLVKLSTATLKK